MPEEGSDGMEDGPGRVNDRHGVWCEKHQSKSSNNRELRNLVNLAEEEVEAGRMEGVEIFSNKKLCGGGRVLYGKLKEMRRPTCLPRSKVTEYPRHT